MRSGAVALAKSPWWLADEEEIHTHVCATVEQLKSHHKARVSALEEWYAIYRYGKNPGRHAMKVSSNDYSAVPLVRMAVDTLHARQSKSQPTPWVVTKGGDSGLRERSRATTKYGQGEIQRLGLRKKADKVLLDALIYGTGALKFYAEDGRPACERVKMTELLTDPLEEKYDAIRTIYQIRAVDRGVLIADYPEHKAALVEANAISYDTKDTAISTAESVTADMIRVYEAWRLPSGKPEEDEDGNRTTDGRHVICTETVTLHDEPWVRERFPFVSMVAYGDPENGFWGIGLAERMCGSQKQLDDTSWKVDTSFALSAPFIVASDDAELDDGTLNNFPYRIVRYKSIAPPQVVTPPAIHEQHVMREETLIRRGLEIEGISQLSAQSQKPAGISSGKGLLVLTDTESDRFGPLGRQWEQFHLDCFEAILDVSDDIFDSDDHDELTSELTEAGILEEVRYSDARMSESPYRIEVFPASKLSQSTPGLLEEIQRMMDMGIITDPDEARALAPLPDLEQSNNLALAPKRLAEKYVQRCLAGKRVAVSGALGKHMVKAMDLAGNHLMLAELNEEPEEVREALSAMIGMMQAHIDNAEREAAKKQAALAAAANPTPPPPPAGMPQSPVGPAGQGAPIPSPGA